MSRLYWLGLYASELTGEIPAELGKLTNLRGLYLHDNQLTGEIPAELGNLKDLSRLFLRNNRLTGEIPTELGNLENLVIMTLRNNRLDRRDTHGAWAVCPELEATVPFHQSVGRSDSPRTGRVNPVGTFAVEQQPARPDLIPPELGKLENLEDYSAFVKMSWTGSIPAALGSIV